MNLKKIITIGFLTIFIYTSNLLGQVVKIPTSLPAISLQDLDGNQVNSSKFENAGKPILIFLWSK